MDLWLVITSNILSARTGCVIYLHRMEVRIMAFRSTIEKIFSRVDYTKLMITNHIKLIIRPDNHKLVL